MTLTYTWKWWPWHRPRPWPVPCSWHWHWHWHWGKPWFRLWFGPWRPWPESWPGPWHTCYDLDLNLDMMTLTDTFDLNSSHVNIDAMLYWSHSTPRRRPYKINGIRTCLPKQQNDLYTLPHHRSAMMFRAPLRYALSRCCRHYVLAKRNVRALASNSRLNTAKSIPSDFDRRPHPGLKIGRLSSQVLSSPLW